jgi:hypothetical protein
MDSLAFTQLNGWATKLVVDLARQYNGRNNGDLSAEWSRMCRRGWNSKGTLYQAIKDVLEAGLILQTRQGGRGIGVSLYALTWQPIDDCNGKLDVPATQVAPGTWRRVV